MAGAMVWRSRRDLGSVVTGDNALVGIMAHRAWSMEHRVSYSLPGAGVLRPWVRTQRYFKHTLAGVRMWILRSAGRTG